MALKLIEKGLSIKVWIRVGKSKAPNNCNCEHINIIKRQNFLLNDYNIENAEDILLPNGLYQRLKADCLHLFIRCFDRWNQCKSHKLNMIDYEHVFLDYANNAYKLLKKYSIDVVISALIPHMGADLILYHLSKLLGIKTILAYRNSPVGADALIFLDCIEDLGVFSNAYYNERHSLPIGTKPPTERPFYALKHHRRFINIFKELFLSVLRYVYTRLFFKSKYGKKASKERICRSFDFFLFTLQSRRSRSGNTTLLFSKFIKEKYIYIPLHLEPEMTVDILGGKFNNQLEFISYLREKVPQNIFLVIKENPMQNSYSRSKHFYEYLKSLHNVIYILDDIDTFSLIKNSLGVATIVGTAGWEALRLSKPVIIGGHAWYKGFSGVWHIDELDFEKFIKTRIDAKKIEQQAKYISKFHVRGVITDFDVCVKNIKNFDIESNADQVSNYIIDYLDKISNAN